MNILAATHRFLVLRLLLIVGLIAACTAPKNPLIGQWHDTREGFAFTFSEDGSFVLQTPTGSYQGTYKLVDGSHMELTVPGYYGSKPAPAEYEFRDDQLVITTNGAYIGTFDPGPLPASAVAQATPPRTDTPARALPTRTPPPTSTPSPTPAPVLDVAVIGMEMQDEAMDPWYGASHMVGPREGWEYLTLTLQIRNSSDHFVLGEQPGLGRTALQIVKPLADWLDIRQDLIPFVLTTAEGNEYKGGWSFNATDIDQYVIPPGYSVKTILQVGVPKNQTGLTLHFQGDSLSIGDTLALDSVKVVEARPFPEDPNNDVENYHLGETIELPGKYRLTFTAFDQTPPPADTSCTPAGTPWKGDSPVTYFLHGTVENLSGRDVYPEMLGNGIFTFSSQGFLGLNPERCWAWDTIGPGISKDITYALYAAQGDHSFRWLWTDRSGDTPLYKLIDLGN